MENLNKTKENKKDLNIIKDLESVYKEYKSISDIGSLEDYSEYVNGIFPESKFKNVFFHGSKSKEVFDVSDWNINFDDKSAKNLGQGYYFTPEKDKAERYIGRSDGKYDGTMIYSVLDIKKPIYTDITRNSNKGLSYAGDLTTEELINISGGGDSIFGIGYADKDNYKKVNDYMEIYQGPFDENGFPARQEIHMRIPEIKELSLIDKSQIHILGSKQDLQDFKKFIENKNIEQDKKYLV